MRKLCILCCGVLLCIAVCFPAYADVVIPGVPYSRPTHSSTVVVEIPQEGETADETVTQPAAPSSEADEDEPSSPILQRLHAVWGAIVAAVLAAAAFISQFFRKK